VEGERLFAVAEVFRLSQRPGTVIVATDCPARLAPALRIGQWLEFRNPSGVVTRAMISGYEFFDPPNPNRSLGFPVRPDPPGSPVEVDAEVWSLPDGPTQAEPSASTEPGGA
jgi:hypothetical protein